MLILKADKGNATAIMNTLDYDHKVHQLLDEKQTHCLLIMKDDPTQLSEKRFLSNCEIWTKARRSVPLSTRRWDRQRDWVNPLCSTDSLSSTTITTSSPSCINMRDFNVQPRSEAFIHSSITCCFVKKYSQEDHQPCRRHEGCVANWRRSSGQFKRLVTTVCYQQNPWRKQKPSFKDAYMLMQLFPNAPAWVFPL